MLVKIFLSTFFHPRSLAFWLALLLQAVFFAVISPLINLLFPNNQKLWQKIVKSSLNLTLNISPVQIEIIGLENIPQDKSFIFTANHCSFLDGIILIAKLPILLNVVVANAGFSIPIIRTIYQGTGYLGTGSKMNLANTSKLIRKIRTHENVLILGKPATSGEIGKFSSTIVSLSKNTGTPILPISIKNSSTVLPLNTFILKKETIFVKIGEPIAPEQAETYPEKILELYNSL